METECRLISKRAAQIHTNGNIDIAALFKIDLGENRLHK
jgi:hypothetical protein